MTWRSDFSRSRRAERAAEVLLGDDVRGVQRPRRPGTRRRAARTRPMPSFQLVIRASRRSQATWSYGCTSGRRELALDPDGETLGRQGHGLAPPDADGGGRMRARQMCGDQRPQDVVVDRPPRRRPPQEVGTRLQHCSYTAVNASRRCSRAADRSARSSARQTGKRCGSQVRRPLPHSPDVSTADGAVHPRRAPLPAAARTLRAAVPVGRKGYKAVNFAVGGRLGTARRRGHASR